MKFICVILQIIALQLKISERFSFLSYLNIVPVVTSIFSMSIHRSLCVQENGKNESRKNYDYCILLSYKNNFTLWIIIRNKQKIRFLKIFNSETTFTMVRVPDV